MNLIFIIPSEYLVIVLYILTNFKAYKNEYRFCFVIKVVFYHVGVFLDIFLRERG